MNNPEPGMSNPLPTTPAIEPVVVPVEPVPVQPVVVPVVPVVPVEPVPVQSVVVPVATMPQPLPQPQPLMPTLVTLTPQPVLPTQSTLESITTSSTTQVDPNGKSNKKLIILLLIVVVLILVGVVGFLFLQSNTPAPAVIPISTPVVNPVQVTKPTTTQLIAFSTSESLPGDPVVEDLHLLDLKTNQSTVIASDISSAKISPDGKSIIYINKPSQLASDGTISPDIYLYDIATKIASPFISSLGTLSEVSWSKDGKEVLTNQGTSLIRLITVYDFATKRQLASFNTSEMISPSYSQYYWIDANNIVFMNNVVVPPGKPTGSGGFSGISKINIKTGIVTPLLTPADSTEYTFVGTDINNGIISVTRIIYTGLTSTSMGMQTLSYWDLDLATGNVTERTAVTAGTAPYDVIKALLPIDLQGKNLEVPLPAVEANIYYVIVTDLTDGFISNGILYKVDTTLGAVNPFTLVDTGTQSVVEFSIF